MIPGFGNPYPSGGSGSSGSASPAQDSAYRTKIGAPALRDNFDGTGALEGHTSDDGKTWTKLFGTGNLSGGAVGFVGDSRFRSNVVLGPNQSVTFGLATMGGAFMLAELCGGVNNSGYCLGSYNAGGSVYPVLLAYARAPGPDPVAQPADRGIVLQGTTPMTGSPVLHATVRINAAGNPVITLLVNGVPAWTPFEDTDVRKITDGGSIGLFAAAAGGTQVTDLVARGWPRETLRIDAIGNSILGTNSGTGQDVISRMAYHLEQSGGFKVVKGNHAVPATRIDEATWQPGGASSNAALAAMTSPTDVMVLFGTNEAKLPAGGVNPLTKGQYKAAYASMLAPFTAAGHRMYLCAAPAIVGGSYGQWDASANALLQQYAAAEAELVNGTSIRLGGRQAFATFGASPELLIDGVHFTFDGSDVEALDCNGALLSYRSPLPTLP